MKKTLLLLLFTPLLFSQVKPTALENKIYHSIDAFVAHPTPESIKILAADEKTFHPKTQAEWLAMVILKCNKAYYQNQFGQIHKAIADYEKAWRIFQQKRLSNYDIIESCLQPLGNLYTLSGDYENAENTIKQYFYLAENQNNPAQKYAAILNLSNVYANTGRQAEAISLIEKTLASKSLTSFQSGLLFNNLANNYRSTAHLKMAAQAYEKAIQLLTGDKSQTETLSNAYRNAALLHNDPALFEKGKSLFFENKTLTPRELAEFYRDEATLYFALNKPEIANHSIRQAFKALLPGYNAKNGKLPHENELYAEPLLLDALDLQAAFFESSGLLEKALACYKLAFHTEDLLQSALVYENSKIVNQVRNRDRTEKCLWLYHALYQKEKKIQYIETAFQLAEKTKSGILKTSLLQSAKATRQEKLIRSQLQNWNTVILKEQQKGAQADISKISQAIKKQNELMLMLKSGAEGPAVEKSWPMDVLYARLEKDDAVMAEYFYGREKVAVFVLQDRSIKLEFIGDSKNIAPNLHDFIDLFSDSGKISDNPAVYHSSAHSLYKTLRIPHKNKHKNLLVVADGILNFIPFEALVSQKKSTTNFSKMHYVLLDHNVVYHNSAGFYLSTAKPKNKAQTVLGIFPLFENTDLELAFSKKEMENLQQQYPGKFLARQSASFENFSRNAKNHSVLHLSTHAASGDLYEPASIRFADGAVFYSQLYDLDLKPDLVVLSACETGIGKLYQSEGAMSVARGFQQAGAQNLLFSLWKVNDYTTSVLMGKFYANLKKGRSFCESNRQAKLDFLADESVPSAKKSPYYWGAFVYYGTLETAGSDHNLTWIWLFLGIIGLSLLYCFFKRK